METLDLLMRLVQTVEAETYATFEAVSRERIEKRDEDDRPVLAAALALGYPIWTEDSDFFGCGVATWTTDRVERTRNSIGTRLKCCSANSAQTVWRDSCD